MTKITRDSRDSSSRPSRDQRENHSPAAIVREISAVQGANRLRRECPSRHREVDALMHGKVQCVLISRNRRRERLRRNWVTVLLTLDARALIAALARWTTASVSRCRGFDGLIHRAKRGGHRREHRQKHEEEGEAAREHRRKCSNDHPRTASRSASDKLHPERGAGCHCEIGLPSAKDCVSKSYCSGRRARAATVPARTISLRIVERANAQSGASAAPWSPARHARIASIHSRW